MKLPLGLSLGTSLAPSLAPSLATRSTQPELMDQGLDAALQARVLADLAAVNRWTLTHRPVLQFLRQGWARVPPGQTLTVLDVGCGQGDLLRAVWQLGARQQRGLRLIGLDLQPHSTAAARQATPAAMGIEFVTGDLFAYLPHEVDYIVSSQLAHHLDDVQLVSFLYWLQAHARRGWCIADLRRHWLPYLAYPWLARAARWHHVVRIDGTRSIARACTLAEWRTLLQRAGVAATLRRRLPFRLTVASLH